MMVMVLLCDKLSESRRAEKKGKEKKERKDTGEEP